MALVQNTAEGGTHGVVVTTGNSGGGSGTAFSEVVAGVTFSNVQKMHGSLSYAMAGAASTWNVVRLDSTAGLQFTTRVYVYLQGSPSAETNFVTVQTAAGGAVAGLNLATTRILKLVSAGGWVADFTTALSLNTWYRLVLYGTVAASNATVTGKLYAGDSTTPIETKTSSTANTGSTAAGRVYYGKLTQPPSITGGYYFDDLAQDLTSAAEIGSVALPVTHVGSTAWVAPASSATISPTYPGSLAEGDLVEAVIVCKPDTATIATPTDWWLAFSQAVGGGTQGAGTGAVKVHVFRRTVPAGGLSGSQAFTITSGSSPVAFMRAWHADTAGYAELAWVPPISTFYSRTTASTTFDGTGAAGIALDIDDWLEYVSASADDQSTTHTISALAATGATLSGLTQDPTGTVVNAQGNDISAAAAIAQVTAGSSDVAPSATVTGDSSETGGGVFWRVRATGLPTSATYDRTPADTAGATDAVTVVATYDRTPADTAGATDTATLARTLTATDTAGATDTDQPQTVDVAWTSDDAAGATDDAVVDFVPGGTTYTLTPADTAAGTDAASVLTSTTRTPADTASATDATTLARTTAPADTASASDAVTVVTSRVFTIGDTAGATDSVDITATGTQSVNPADTAGATDVASTTASTARTPADAAAGSDAVTVATTMANTYGDTAGATDSVVVSMTRNLTAADTAGATDSVTVSAAGVLDVTPADTAGGTDLATVTRDATHVLGDTAAAADTATVTLAASTATSDTAAATDAVTVVMSRIVTVTDLLAAIDSATFLHIEPGDGPLEPAPPWRTVPIRRSHRTVVITRTNREA